MISAVVGAIAFLWLLAGSLDGRWQAMLALAVWLGLSVGQAWLFIRGVRAHENGQHAPANLCLLASALPALGFIYLISL
jgi:hypothetical protein